MFTFAQPKGGVLDASRKVGDRTLMLRARNVKLTRDGFARGLVALFVDTTPIHSDIVDFEDDGERHNFANRLYGTRAVPGKFGPDIVSAFRQDAFELEFMLWARTAWSAYIGSSSGADITGDENPSAPPWAVPGLVMQGSTCIWAGDAGAGKSTLARLVCQSLRHDISTVIPIQAQEMSGWVNAEESEAEHSRQLGNVNRALGLAATAPMFTIHARGMRIEDLATRMEKATRENGIRHWFIDSLSRLAQGASLNDNNTATLLVDSVSGLDCSVNWLGHTGWENRQRLAGSRHFENAARVMVLVQSRQSIGGVMADLSRGIRTRVTKANGAIVTDSSYWSLEYHRQYGLIAVGKSEESEWPMLRCDYSSGEERKSCGRLTWDGVNRDGSIRCSRHRDEEFDG